MKLEPHVRRLIAVGASVGANCLPCLQANAGKAIEEGLSEQEIAEAISVGKQVRQGAASKMDALIADLGRAAPSAATAMGGCGCE